MSAVLEPEVTDLAPAPAKSLDRSRFLGGSDAAAVMGLSPWQTPVELWMEKTGRADKNEEMDVERQRRMERGHKLEPFIRDMVIAKLQDQGVEVKLLAVNERYTDPAYPFLACEIDFELELTGDVDIGGEVVTFFREHVNADAKSVSGFARKKWGQDSNTDVPIEYACQFMHGMGITGRRFCLVAALRSFDDVDIYWTERDDETVAAMREKEVLFWTEHVLKDVPPDVFTFNDIKILFPTDNGEAREATEEVAQQVADLRRIKAAIKDLQEQEKTLQLDIGEFISPHARLTFEGKEIATWKGQSDTRLDQSRLAEAEIYRRTDAGEFERIENPVAAFTRTKTVRVLRLKKGT